MVYMYVWVGGWMCTSWVSLVHLTCVQHTYMHAHIHTHKHTHNTHTYPHTHPHTHTHIHTHTHRKAYFIVGGGPEVGGGLEAPVYGSSVKPTDSRYV